MNEYKIPIKEDNMNNYSKSKRSLSKINKKIRLTIFKTIVSLVPTTFIAMLSIQSAYNYRGYPAVGGEWLLIIITFGFSFNIISNYIQEIIRKERRKKRYCNSK